jgi:hypothetical protein
MRTKVSIFGLLFVVFCVFSSGYADVPQMINYQGKITTLTGALVDTSVQMIFTVYDDSTSGTIFWADTISSVSVQKGIFSVLLGSNNPIPDSVFDGNIRYLGTKVGTDAEMSPRKAMVSVAYAFRTVKVDTAEYALSSAPDADWDIDTAGINVYRLTGNVGIGTPTPGANLDIVSANPNLRVGTTSGSPVITLDKASGNWGYLEFREGGASKWQAGVTTGNDYYILNWPSSRYVFYANSAGNVGIGTTSPDERLHVVGNIRMVDGNQAAGYVLTSDANGVGTWQAAAGGIGGSGTTNYLSKFTGSTTLGNSVFYESGGRIGLGTTSPGADIDIVSTNPSLRLGTASGSPVITLDKASGNWGYLEFREGGASKWQAGVTTGNDYYILNWPSSRYVFYANSAGDVGIGTTSPSERLTVNGDIDMIQGQSRIHGIGEMSFDWSAGSTYDNPSQHGFESKDETGSWSDGIRINSFNDIINTLDANDNRATSYFKVQHHSTGDGEDLFWVRSSDGYAYHKGRLGIGTTSPGVDLDILSTNPNLRLSTTSGSPVITLDKGSGYWGYLEFRDNGASKWQAGVTSGNDYYILNWPASKYVFYANSAGNVGMGTTSPTGPLDVNGNDIRIRSSQTPASASADGYTGEIAWDGSYIYICVSGDGPGGGTDSWKRAALSTW